MSRITTESELRAVYSKPVSKLASQKQLTALEKHALDFIARSPFIMLATRGADGLIDISPKGDAPGFVGVDGDKAILIPDRPGNNRLDNLTNLLTDPAIGVIFLIPGVGETLRVQGRAEIRTDADLLDRFSVRGKPPLTVIRVDIAEVYLHCPKAFMRSGLWKPETFTDRKELPSLGQMINDQIGLNEVAKSQEELEAGFEKTLY